MLNTRANLQSGKVTEETETMKTYFALACLLAISHPAVAAMTDKVPTQKIKAACDVWSDSQDGFHITESTKEAINDGIHKIEARVYCVAFINGMSNEMIGELSWLDDTHKRVVIGNFEDGVTVKQEILVFLDYVNANPALLNKPATVVFRQSMEAAKLYNYATAP
jgi:hypothetical protein